MAFELFVPVYETDQPLLGAAEHRRRFRGWATGQFRAGDFLEAALEASLPPASLATTGVELHDQEAGLASPVASFPAGFRATGPSLRQQTFEFGGRRGSSCATPPGRATRS